MNKRYSSLTSGKSSASGEFLMAVLLIVSIFQIVLCFDAGPGLLAPVAGHIQSASRVACTNAPALNNASAASAQKTPSFPSAASRG